MEGFDTADIQRADRMRRTRHHVIYEEVGTVSDIREIAARGVLMTPGLAVDGETVASGHLLSVNQVKRILEARTESMS